MSTNQKPGKFLLIKLLQFEQICSQQTSMVYFSFNIDERMYFSSCMPSTTGALTDDIIVPINNVQKTQQIEVHRWQNHMIMFTYHIDLSELRSRTTIMKKMETKYGQYLKMLVVSLQEEEIKFGFNYVQSITQHYLFIDQMTLISNEGQSNEIGPSYFKIKTQNSLYVMPVMDGQILIKLPETLQFFRVKNGKQVGVSAKYDTKQLRDQEKIIELDSKNGHKFSNSVKIGLKWGINLQQSKPQNILLLDSQEIMIYDIEVKFDNPNEYGSSKLKVVYGNKAFELGSQFNSTKPAKIRKIINLFTKSEQEELLILVEKNVKAVAQAKLQVEELTPFIVNSLKKKILDTSGKPIGLIKFKCEKAKNLSTPSNNKMWREGIKNRNVSTQFLIIFDQFSVKCQGDIPICLSLKTQAQEKVIKRIPNILHFNKNQSVVASSPVALTLKPDESIYMVAKNLDQLQSNQQDFEGIALFNPAEVRIGLNCSEMKFFKNQLHTLTINCIINKIVSYSFIKATFQPEMIQSLSHRSISLSVIMRQVYFSPYFYTFRYENKNEVYCIVEVNKHKKVLIMENKNKSNDLSFNSSASSDNLDFSIEETQNIKMKITFLVSDVGQDQQIYGWSVVKIKTSELQSATSSLKFYLVEIKNDFGISLGQINVEVNKASLFNSHVKQSRDILESGTKLVESQKRKAKMHLAQLGQSVELKQKSYQPNSIPLPSKNSSLKQEINIPKKSMQRYDKILPLVSGQRKKRNNSVIGIEGAIKLPAIREESASPQGKKNYNELVQMMKIRKRSMKGHYEQNSMLESYQMRNYNNKSILTGNYSRDETPSAQLFHLKDKIEKQNPNISRNLQILFPKKGGRQKIAPLKQPIKYQEQKLKGLKSVLNEITSDIGQIEPTVKGEQRYMKQSKKSQRINYDHERQQIDHMQGPQWDDNEFAV